MTPHRSALNGALLFDLEGSTLHYWPIDYAKIDPEGRAPQNVFLHGFEALPDGSVLANFDDGGAIARIGPCGEILWRRTGKYHHSITLTEDRASLWTLSEDRLEQLSVEDGRVLRSIDVAEDVMKRYAAQGVLAIHQSTDNDENAYVRQRFHINDVEPLPRDFASAFPDFSAGDLLISLRELNLVAVLDGSTAELRWWSHGPWHRQHDPDFLPDGTIAVLDNAMYSGHSRIVKINPRTRQLQVLLGRPGDTPFYTWIRGKQEHLPGGNILVAEAQAGRAFEVDSSGKLLWEYQNIYDEQSNGVISRVEHIPSDFFEPGALRCPSLTGSSLIRHAHG